MQAARATILPRSRRATREASSKETTGQPTHDHARTTGHDKHSAHAIHRRAGDNRFKLI